jgi:biopolymer transport protein ExbD
MIEGNGRSSSRRGVARSHRLGIHIDLTPMVDVAFLLLTFFMLTTSLLRHQVMKIEIPPHDAPAVPVALSNVLVIMVSEFNLCYWRIGSEQLRAVPMDAVRSILIDNSRTHDKLVTILKVDRRAKYSMLVDLLDQVQRTSIERFSVVPLDEHDKELVRKVSSGKGL